MPTDYVPTISTKTRDVAYVTGLVVGAVVTLGVGLVGVWFPELRAQAAETGVYINGAAALLVGGLGTVYRPGAAVNAPDYR